MRRAAWFIVLAFLSAAAGCGDFDSPETGTKTAAATGTVTFTTDKTSYNYGDSITATWAGTPGNAHDWIALAQQGSDLTSTIAWTYTNGMDGSYTFNGLFSGTLVLRAFSDDSYTELGESDPITVAPPPTDATVGPVGGPYGMSSPIDVTWTGLPGSPTDWVAIAPQGYVTNSFTAYHYTGGQTSGTLTILPNGLVPTGFPAGQYVMRAYVHDTYTMVAESAPFPIGLSADVFTDAASYNLNQSVKVTWANLPGSNPWVAIAPQGSPNTTVTNWAYTGMQPNGSYTFPHLTSAGTYVARAFSDEQYTLAAESAPFTVLAGAGVMVTTDMSSYTTNQSVTVTWSGLPTNANDWIALAPQGAGATTVTRWVYTGGASSGSTTFVGGLATAGSYVARAFLNDTYTMLGESAVFTVGASTAMVSSNASTYSLGTDIQVSWTGFPTNAQDWVAIAPSGSSDTTVTVWVYTGGASAGTHTFSNGVAPAGTYVVRGFLNDTYSKLSESAPFVVQ